jgi:3-oxoacyl-[acyl-carrier-protein] synthase-1
MQPLYISRYCHITGKEASVNGKTISPVMEDDNFFTGLYRSLNIDYPKFFKMDKLSKMGFLASELIFGEDDPRFVPRDDIAVICFNRSASLESDTLYQATIQREGAYFPSPSVFVYTLPNIVTGEIAIRNKLHGETSFYLCKELDEEAVFRTVSQAFRDKNTHSVLAAWIECYEAACEAWMMRVEPVRPVSGAGIPFDQMSLLFHSK